MSFLSTVERATNSFKGAVSQRVAAIKADLNFETAKKETGIVFDSQSTAELARLYGRSVEDAYQAAWPGCEVVADDVVADDGHVIAAIAQVVSDDTQLLMSRDALVSMMAKVIEKQYPALKMAMGQIIQIDDSSEGVVYGFHGTEIYEIMQIDYIGMMAIISDYSKGGPAADVAATRAVVTVKFFGGQINFSLMEILRVLGAGGNLPSIKLKALKHAYAKYVNTVGYFGDVRGGLQGLLTLTGVTNYIVPTPVTAGVNADYLTSLLAGIAAAVPQITNGIENPTRFVTPLKLREIAMATYRQGVNESVYEEFMKRERLANRITELITDEILMTARNGKALCLLVHDEKEKLCLKNPQPFSMLDAQINNFAYTVHAFGSTCGVVCTAPASIMIVEGIFG